MKTVGDLKNSVAGLLQGTNLNRVTNVDGALERAVRTTLQQADIPEASSVYPITLYGGVPFYSVPESMYGGAINLILPQGVSQTPGDYSYKVQLDAFSRGSHSLPNGYLLTVQYNKGLPRIGIASPNILPQVSIDPMNSTDGWTAGGSASGLAVDNSSYYLQPASLRFSLAGASTGTLTKTLTNAIDIVDDESVGVAFLAIYAPSVTNLTNIELRLGSNSTNYASVTATQGFLGAWTAGEWLLVAFDYSAATNTGSPDWSAIDYVDVLITTSGSITNFQVGGLWISLPCPSNIYYQTAAVFKDAVTGALSQTITADSNYITLSDPAYLLLEHEAALTVGFQNGGNLSTPVLQYFKDRLYGQDGLYEKYRANNPSSQLRTVESYYDF